MCCLRQLREEERLTGWVGCERWWMLKLCMRAVAMPTVALPCERQMEAGVVHVHAWDCWRAESQLGSLVREGMHKIGLEGSDDLRLG